MKSDGADVRDAILDRQYQAWQDGSNPSVEDLMRDSALPADDELLLDLIYNEVVLREELGESPILHDYIDRYPQLADELKVHFEVHRAVHDRLLVDTRRVDSSDSLDELDPASVEIGPNLTDYEIVGELGRGGMGVVYRARHHRMKRMVALKTFQPGRRPTPRELERFRTEAEAIARLQHPNIVQIFEIGEEHGMPFLALELADKGTLAQRLQDLPLEPSDAAELIETLARAIHHSHQHQIVHRDLKPANVLFTRDGNPKITDFGLAKLLEDESGDTTRSGEPIGTPRYMSPEQAAGKPSQIGPATDVYALGTILYECLTGQVPFVSPSVLETVTKIRFDEPVPPRRLQPTIPRDLETICLHCLHKQTGRRYSTALELADDVRRFQVGEPIRARRTPPWERGWMWCRRNPARTTLIAVAAGLLIFGIVFMIARERRLVASRAQVVALVQEGRDALARDEVQAAKVKFEAALSIVLAEPALRDHELLVRGWLDEGMRDRTDRHRWKQRQPPPPFEERRDEAFVQCGLLDPHDRDALLTARQAIQAALEFAATAGEREPLILLNADLYLRDNDVESALAELDNAPEIASHLWHHRRADCLVLLGKPLEAERERAQGNKLPPQETLHLWLSGIDLMQRDDSAQAARDFDMVLHRQPNNFPARFFQAVCFLRLNRPNEAKVGLTACIGQRPISVWSYLFRGQAHVQLGEPIAAAQDLQFVIEMDPPGPARRLLGEMLDRLKKAIAVLPEQDRLAYSNARIQTDSGLERLGDIPAFRK